MKSTGVIRRIDELGRIVIPKEIRRTLKIRDGENMEIFIDNESIVLKKYSRIEDSIEFAKKICTILFNITGNDIIITDREHVISAQGNDIQDLENDIISDQLTSVIDNRETYFSPKETVIQITNTKKITGYISIVPIIASADSIGLVIINSRSLPNSEVKTVARFIATLISIQIDVA